MKIRIQTNNHTKLFQAILNMAKNREWETWTTVSFPAKESNHCRLVHSPSHDDQYRSIELKLCRPSEEDVFYGECYLDIVPVKADDCDLTKEEIKNKSGIVLGRFCEILNRYFDSIKEYRVLLE